MHFSKNSKHEFYYDDSQKKKTSLSVTLLDNLKGRQLLHTTYKMFMTAAGVEGKNERSITHTAVLHTLYISKGLNLRIRNKSLSADYRVCISLHQSFQICSLWFSLSHSFSVTDFWLLTMSSCFPCPMSCYFHYNLFIVVLCFSP